MYELFRKAGQNLKPDLISNLCVLLQYQVLHMLLSSQSGRSSLSLRLAKECFESQVKAEPSKSTTYDWQYTLIALSFFPLYGLPLLKNAQALSLGHRLILKALWYI